MDAVLAVRSLVAASRAMVDGTIIDGDYRFTPSNLAGDLCFAFLSPGNLGPGMFPMTWLAPDESFPFGPESGTDSTVSFDLASPVDISGKLRVPASEDYMPSVQKIIRAELYFNYVDATFTLNEQEYTVRTVYATSWTADDVTGTMNQGDKLIKLAGGTEFFWANAAGTSADRSAVSSGLIQDVTVTAYIQPSDGNQDYVPVTANFMEEFPVTYSLITDTTKVWTLEFILDGAIVLDWAEDLATLTEPQDILAAFRLKFGPN